MDEQGDSMKVGDLVKFKKSATWARGMGMASGPALVLWVEARAAQILTKNQKQAWVNQNEVEVISESR